MIIRRCLSPLLVAYSILILSMLPGCQTRQHTSEPVSQSPKLVLSTEQLDYIKDTTPKFIAWQAYWLSDNTRSVGKKVPIKIINLEKRVIIFFPTLQPTGVTYLKLDNGKLGVAESVDCMYLSGEKGTAEIVKSPASSNSDRPLIRFFKESIYNPEDKDGEWRLNLQKLDELYSVLDQEIMLFPKGPPPYDSMNAYKQRLLEQVVKVAINQAEIMFNKGEIMTIVVPNFNIGDSRIWVLVERQKKPRDDIRGLVLDLDLSADPIGEQVTFAGFAIHDIDNERYGIKTHTVEKIKRNSIKSVEYTIRSQ